MDIAKPAVRSGGAGVIQYIPLAAMFSLAAVLYTRALSWWYYEWTANGSFYAHGVFIPFFVAIMIWRDREKLRRLPIERSWWGLALVIPAIALVLFAYRADVTLTLSISFILFLIGATMILAGKRITRALIFPLLFMFSMIPIVPNGVINTVAFPIQLTSAKMAATVMNLIGFPAVRVGTSIEMEDYSLNVELPCSGFKTLVGLLSFAGAFAYLVEGPVRKRWLLFLSAAPLALIVNALRVLMIGLVGSLFSRAAASQFHDYSGFIVLILGFMFLFWLAKVLKCERFLGVPLGDEPAPSKASREEGKAEETRALDEKYGPPRRDTLRSLAPGVYPVICILALACVATRFVERPRLQFAILKADDIPASLASGGWAQFGTDRPLSKEVGETLNPQTWIERMYAAQSPRTGLIHLLVSGGNNRRIFHDPHECFMGNGWQLHDVGIETIDTPVGPVKVMETIGENLQSHSKQLLMFVYVVEGKQIQTTFNMHTTMMLQTLFGESGRPSYFLRFLNVGDGVGEDRRKELKDFIRALWTAVGPAVTR